MPVTFRLVAALLSLIAVACAGRGRVYTPGADITLPTVVSSVRPVYTSDAMAAGIQGEVLLDCVVQPDGTVGDVTVTRSLDSTTGLDRQAIEAIRLWRFKPGTRNGRPVPVRVAVNMTFTLK
jgi:TonB family protein